jgi:DHA1 family multidrug resistance protein-like MFS transporter
LDPQKAIAVLSVIMAMQMTSFVMIAPLFARRFDEFGAGVKALGISSMAFALTTALAAPFMGALADRFGRKPLILGSLVAYIAAYLGFLLAPSSGVLILVRGLAGAFTAGLMPAVTGLATDLAPEERRAQWIAFVIGGATFGWIAGPIAGGMIFDHWGYSTALVISISLAVLTLMVAILAVPESRPAAYRSYPVRAPDASHGKRNNLKNSLSNLRSTLPDSLLAFFVLLFIYFAVLFAWTFMEPEFMFYVYNDLGWSSSMLGLAMSAFGVSMMVGVFAFGRSSDRFGRKPVILFGLALISAQFIGLAFSRSFFVITASFLIAGMGNALFDPALTASILDISPEEHRARILGIKYATGSIGNVLGPALVVLLTSAVSTAGIFLIALGTVVLAILAASTIKTGLRPSMATSGRRIASIKAAPSQPGDGGKIS